jgi:hypothetical protein
MKTLGYPYVYRFNRIHEFICIYLKRKETSSKVVKVKKELKSKKPAIKRGQTKKNSTKKETVKKKSTS